MRAPDIDTTVLLVDDEEAITDAFGAALELQGFTVTVAHTADEALACFDQGPPDIVVLDLVLPGQSGIAICTAIRKRSSVPIVMISGRSTEVDVVSALEAGADDYLVKPFGIAELVARIRAALRRSSPQAPTDTLVQGGFLTVAPGSHRAWLRGKALDLPEKEFAVLEALVRSPGRVVSRANLTRELSGSEGGISNKALDATVRRLRQKLGDSAAAIVTVRGVGFRFEPPA